ncbi:MAG TPA: ATP-binding protein [Nocardioidaceae bacterium]|nr:ATP-binding protein [Nocardioidaceae bacterium]
MPAPQLLLESELPPQASSASHARRLLRGALDRASAPWPEEDVEAAQLAVSEVVTNALVHAGTPMTLRVQLAESGLRVEVGDGSPHTPVRRNYSSTSGTGRGLKMLDRAVDRWGSAPDGDGKVVWFEMRSADPCSGIDDRSPGVRGAAAKDTVTVELLNVPLLMHSAWQEHASAVLREYLLVRVEADDLAIFEAHAQASDAMNLLYEQVPAPDLGDDPEALMAGALEPVVSRERLTLNVPRASVESFDTLDDLLRQAVALGEARVLLVPPTQPEIRDMSSWLCRQVRDQHAAGAPPVPWSSLQSLTEPSPPATPASPDAAEVAASPRALMAIDEASVVVAVSPSVVRFLGHPDAAALVGRRVLSIVPARYHQAHIAGTTLHMTNGRSVLLGRPVTVPVVRADGTEAPVELRVDPQLLPDGRRMFVAEFGLPPNDAP